MNVTVNLLVFFAGVAIGSVCGIAFAINNSRSSNKGHFLIHLMILAVVFAPIIIFASSILFCGEVVGALNAIFAMSLAMMAGSES